MFGVPFANGAYLDGYRPHSSHGVADSGWYPTSNFTIW